MEFKGTKGEWSISKEEGYDYDIVCNGKEICWLGLADCEDNEKLQNAKLMAASKELLDALTKLIEETEGYEAKGLVDKLHLKSARENAERAINKALN